jgi:hypothetical protein
VVPERTEPELTSGNLRPAFEETTDEEERRARVVVPKQAQREVRVGAGAVIERERDSAAAAATAVDRLTESRESCDCRLAQGRLTRGRSPLASIDGPRSMLR